MDDFRNKKLFDFGFSDPNKVDVQGKVYTKTGDKWMSNGKTMDNSTVQTLIDKLRDLTATKFAEKGGGQPVFEATVVSNSGKRIEKVMITKQGAQYFAQREGEPSIYELDSKVVEDLQKAASDVKEAAPEPAEEEVNSTQRRRERRGKTQRRHLCHLGFLCAYLCALCASALKKILTQ